MIFFSTHLDEYWTICLKNMIAPIPTKDWVAPRGWAPPKEGESANHSARNLKQEPITNFTQKTTNPVVLPLTKEGIKEHLLAIITTCDLVRILIVWFICFSYYPSSHSILSSVQHFGGSSPT
jgi:hypothetical protein